MAEKQRAAFEAWASDEGQWPKVVERNPDGTYKLLLAATQWQAWQAAYGRCAEICAAVCSSDSSAYGDGYNTGAWRCEQEIRTV